MARLKLGERDEIQAFCILLGLPKWASRSSYFTAFGSRKEPRRRNVVPDTLVEYHIPRRSYDPTRAYLRYEVIHDLEEFQRAIKWLQDQGHTDIQVLT